MTAWPGTVAEVFHQTSATPADLSANIITRSYQVVIGPGIVPLMLQCCDCSLDMTAVVHLCLTENIS